MGDEKAQNIEGSVATVPSESDQIDAIANKRGWFRGEPKTCQIIRDYIEGNAEIASTVTKLAEPIDRTYSTGDGFTKSAESKPALQSDQDYNDRDEAEATKEERDNNNLDQLSEDSEDVQESTECLLWDLWYSVLHVAKQTPWSDSASQEKLVGLVRALKARPDPPPPSPMTESLKQNWIWITGTVWSDLILIGASTREAWNDSPGYGSEYSLPEIHAWTNVNAFVARITVSKVDDFWIYAIWALRPALEEEHSNRDERHVPSTVLEELNALIPAAVVWILVLGRELYEREEDLTPSDSGHGNPARGGKLWNGIAGFSKQRWRFWKERLRLMKERDDLTRETRDLAKCAVERMEQIESQA